MRWRDRRGSLLSTRGISPYSMMVVGERLRVAFFGSDRFSRICLARLLANNGGGREVFGVDKLHVYCPPERKGELLQWCAANGLGHTALPPKTLRDWNFPVVPDIALVASIGYFIPGRLIRAPPLGMLNAHPSLLPRYRGASPIQYTIMNGDTRSGVTIIDLDSRTFDAGNIWAQEERDIKAYQDFRVLEEELAVLSGDLFSRVLADLSRHAEGKRFQEGSVSFAPKITPEDSQVSFKDATALKIYGIYQGIRHRCHPHAMSVRGCRVFLLDMLDPRLFPTGSMHPDQFKPLADEAPVGAIYYDRPLGALFIKSADAWVGIRQFRIAGKSNAFSAGDYYNIAKVRSFTDAHFV